LMTGMTNADEAVERTHRIREAISQPQAVQGFPLAIGGSFGIALYPDHGSDLESLMTKADEAMYAAKRGGHGVQLPPDANQVHVSGGRLTLLGELEEALAQEALVLH